MTTWSDFDDYIQSSLPTWSCPGAAVGVIRDDEVVYRAAHGLRDVEDELPLTPETRFAMASVTKSFTAMSVALLVDEGKVEWDEPVREYVPELVLNDAYASQHLSLRDMLSHRSGMPRHDLAAWRLDLPRAEFVKRMRHLRFNASFRERFSYNNLMYYALAHVVERVAGQRWEDFVAERIFTPLGMHGSNFAPEAPREGQENALGYRVDRDEEGRAKGLIRLPFGAHTELSPSAAGALFSTLDDQLRWVGLHANRGRWGEVQLVDPRTCDQMHLPVTVQPGGGPWSEVLGNALFTYALGWSVEPYRGHTLVQHGGNVEGHSLQIGFVPRERTGVVVLTNGAMMPLRDVLFYEALDRALDLEPRDWNARFHRLFDEDFRAMAKGKVTEASERHESGPPSHALEAYAGTFRAEGYPDIEVRRDGEVMQARLVDSLDWSPLRHVHYDVFAWDLTSFLDTTMRVRFQTDEHGELDALVVPIEPEVDDVAFRRSPLELPGAVVQALVGEYETPIEGLSLRFSSIGGELHVTDPGGTPEALQPYRLTDDTVVLRRKRVRYEFALEGDVSTRLTIKSPNTTLEATRLEPA